VAHACAPYGIVSGSCVVVDDDNLALRNWSRLFAISTVSSWVVVDSLATAAGARRAVVMRHLVGGSGSGIDFGFV